MNQLNIRYSSPPERIRGQFAPFQQSRTNSGYAANRQYTNRVQFHPQNYMRNWVSNSLQYSPPNKTGTNWYPNRVFLPNGRHRQRNDYQQQIGNQYWRPKQRVENHGANSDLSMEIMSLFNEKKQTQEIFERKSELRGLIQNELLLFFDEDVELKVVGSSVNGLGTIYSELDVCVVFRNPFISAVDALQSIKSILEKKEFVKNKRVIWAKVPIFKFIDSVSGIVVNINVNNATCIKNTQLIHQYTRMDERVAPLTVIVKLWARQNGINDASNKTMNGYTLTLLVIHFLQSRCTPAVLPSLVELFGTDTDINGRRRQITAFERVYNFKSLNCECLGDLFLKFLLYYSHEFTYRVNVVSVRTGSAIAKSKVNESSNNKFESTQWKFIGVEEPYDRTNTARSVSDKSAYDQIMDVFRRSYRTLHETRCLFSII
ncbi:Poly(A) RNA polymerase gld-2-like protein [Leptotrombidium deliense]|uniref:Poly(A) RNA polymerase gld-2-like protein n=1 Tax=Leptotrombidium deliense TaxID=299467 RepID=A0A443SSK7_9ACAR|nr:Poly(A) RNA polymerase gld-2-like protein [Leptotrombidium deliense]